MAQTRCIDSGLRSRSSKSRRRPCRSKPSETQSRHISRFIYHLTLTTVTPCESRPRCHKPDSTVPWTPPFYTSYPSFQLSRSAVENLTSSSRHLAWHRLLSRAPCASRSGGTTQSPITLLLGEIARVVGAPHQHFSVLLSDVRTVNGLIDFRARFIDRAVDH